MVRELVALGVAAAVALAAPALAHAAGEYEPNDSQRMAFGPLVNGQVLTAGLESLEDTDVYLFYVAGPSSVRFRIQNNFTPGADACGYVLRIFEAGEQFAVEQQDFVSGQCLKAETDGDMFKSLEAGKYYLTIDEPLGWGIDVETSTYTLTAVSGLSSLATMQAGCDTRKAAAKRAKKAMTRATAALRTAEKQGSGVKSAKRKLAKARTARRKSARAAKSYCAIRQRAPAA
ncbi:MAG TPA: hypothetical protein VHF88_07145 [Thermoleophilaceae bacterium]|nr:hypothetical protein [Thermoleophilaceae bacterium]